MHSYAHGAVDAVDDGVSASVAASSSTSSTDQRHLSKALEAVLVLVHDVLDSYRKQQIVSTPNDVAVNDAIPGLVNEVTVALCRQGMV